MQRDLFPSLMKVCRFLIFSLDLIACIPNADPPQFMNDIDDPTHGFEPFLLLGLLANYNKFEFQNPYQLRLDDFVNETTIQKVVGSTGTTCALLRNGYVAIQDDLPEGWSWSSTLAYFGLGLLARGSRTSYQQLSPDEMASRFKALYV
jgi:hypothetical protein